MNGIVIVNKPKGISSFKAVESIKKISKSKRAGHAGTLDLEAEGILIVLLNEACKTSNLFMNEDKTYETVIKLGWESSTWDSSGEFTKTEDISISEEIVRTTLDSFKGAYHHKVPDLSAKKFKGKTFYSLKRSGKTPPERFQKTFIYDIELLQFSMPEIKVRVTCSSGTYIRTLAVDIAKKLNTSGYMKSLIRTRIKNFNLKNSVSPDDENWMNGFMELDKVAKDFPHVNIDAGSAELISNGICFKKDNITEISGRLENSTFAVFNPDNQFIALAEKNENDAFKLRRVINLAGN
jgi:tRNA pseudouridine55 synthase